MSITDVGALVGPPKRIKQKTNQGFSLVESLIVLSILSILIISSVPSFSKLVGNTEVINASYNLRTSLSTARQFAISHSSPINICALTAPNNIQCSDNTDFNSNWSSGWAVYMDENDNNLYDNGDTLITVFQSTGNINIVFNQRGRLRFFQDGSARSAGFYICSKSTTETRHIRLLYSGRARTTEITTQRQQSVCQSAKA